MHFHKYRHVARAAMCRRSSTPTRKDRVAGDPGFRRNACVGCRFFAYTICENAIRLQQPCSGLCVLITVVDMQEIYP